MTDGETKFYRIGESKRFTFSDGSCLSADCWSPGGFTNHRNARMIYTCEHRALHGCPSMFERGFSEKNRERRAADGWREEKP